MEKSGGVWKRGEPDKPPLLPTQPDHHPRYSTPHLSHLSSSLITPLGARSTTPHHQATLHVPPSPNTQQSNLSNSVTQTKPTPVAKIVSSNMKSSKSDKVLISDPQYINRYIQRINNEVGIAEKKALIRNVGVQLMTHGHESFSLKNIKNFLELAERFYNLPDANGKQPTDKQREWFRLLSEKLSS
jgi:hypothetical protein